MSQTAADALALSPVQTCDLAVDQLLVQLDIARKASGRSEASLEKPLVSGSDYPRVILTARLSAYANTPIASVRVERTWRRRDEACSLDDLEIRTACAYYLALTSVDDLNAIEKAVRASTPKAWSFITLLDRMKAPTKELT